MTIETATYINQLNSALPGATDPKSEGDDHIRLLKSTVKATFPNVTGAITPTHTELNYVAGVTSALQTQLNAKAPTASPTFTGTAVLPATTSIGATTGTELGYLSGVTSAVQTQLNAKAPLASPALTGTPTAPTAAAGTSTTQLATTEFVATTYAPLANPALTGTPTAPTAAAGTSTTQVATTAFVQNTAFSAALPAQTGNAGKYVTTNGTTASWATPFTPSVTMTAAGTIAAGQPCIVTAAGTAAQVGVTAGGTSLVSSGGLSSSVATPQSCAFDPTNGIFVITTLGNVYAANINSLGNLTYGVVTAYASGSSFGSVCFDSASGNFLIAYTDAGNSGFGTAVVLSVNSATLAITLGTPVVFETATIASFGAATAYSSTASKCAIAYTLGAGAQGDLKGIVATVSGLSVSFGASVVGFATNARRRCINFDTSKNAFLISFADNASAQQLIVATVSGTSISFGSAVATGVSTFSDVSVYDPLRSQSLVAVRNAGLGGLVQAITITGTVPAVTSTSAALGPGGVATTATGIAYDTVNNQALVVFNNSTDTFARTVTNTGAALSFGATVTFKTASLSGVTEYSNSNAAFGVFGDLQSSIYQIGTTNLGTGNYVGVATNAASVGVTVTINTVGNTATLTGLIPGSNYGVLPTGGLGPVTALTLGTYAGVAISATTLLLKG